MHHLKTEHPHGEHYPGFTRMGRWSITNLGQWRNLMQDYTIAWCGCDVSKDKFDLALAWSKENLPFRKLPRSVFPRTESGVHQFIQWLDDITIQATLPVRVIMEATGRYSLELATWMMAIRPSLQPSIVNPKQAVAFHQSHGLRNKTDSVDARSLALMGKERAPLPHQFSSKLRQQLKDLCRYRDSLMTQSVAEKRRLEEFGEKTPAGRIINSNVRHLAKLLERLDKQILKLVKEDSRLTEDVDLLCTIPGVGFKTAARVVAELGDLSQFKRSRQITAMAGLSPRQRSSGKSESRTVMSKKGNRHVRSALFLPAQVAVRFNPHLCEFYLRLCETKSKMVAIGAVMRKLLVLMRALIVSRQPYDKDYSVENLSKNRSMEPK